MNRSRNCGEVKDTRRAGIALHVALDCEPVIQVNGHAAPAAVQRTATQNVAVFGLNRTITGEELSENTEFQGRGLERKKAAVFMARECAT